MHILWKRHLFPLAMLYLLLGSWKGYVALYENGQQEPRQIFPCPVSSLPPDDQLALDQGIPIRNQRDLQQVLEDYLS